MKVGKGIQWDNIFYTVKAHNSELIIIIIMPLSYLENSIMKGISFWKSNFFKSIKDIWMKVGVHIHLDNIFHTVKADNSELIILRFMPLSYIENYIV